jgi:hypothetical protein
VAAEERRQLHIPVGSHRRHLEGIVMKAARILVGVAIAVVTAQKALAQSSNPCFNPSSSALLSYIQRVVTATDSQTVALRTRVRLPSVSASQVTLLSSSTDGPTCRLARNAYAKLIASDTIATASVDVVKVGSTNFVVADRKPHAGEFSIDAVMDTTFKVVGQIAD